MFRHAESRPQEYRQLVSEVVKCLVTNFHREGLRDLEAEQIVYWLGNVTLDDVEAALADFR